MKKKSCNITLMPAWDMYFIFSGPDKGVNGGKKTGSGKRIKGKRKNT